MFQTKVVGKVKTHFMFNNFCSTVVIYKIMWENSIEPDRPQMTIWRMRFTCWVTKAKNTHTLGILNIYLFPRQNGYANAPQFYVYTYIACLVNVKIL
jgi:hypothetical protein